MNWTVPNTESLLRRLTKPKGKIDVVLDTDTYNELDDQFALSYMMKNSDKLNVKALYAAPFLNDKSVSPKDGMEKSYDEILKLLTLLKREDLKSVTFKGSETYLTDEDKPFRLRRRTSQSARWIIHPKSRCMSLRSARSRMWLPPCF